MIFNTNNENGIFKITGPFLTLSSGCDVSVPKTSGGYGPVGSMVFPAVFPFDVVCTQNDSLNSVEMAALQKTLERHKKAIDILARD
ncbi:hypothetical protein [Methanospirillum sp.]